MAALRKGSLFHDWHFKGKQWIPQQGTNWSDTVSNNSSRNDAVQMSLMVPLYPREAQSCQRSKVKNSWSSLLLLQEAERASFSLVKMWQLTTTNLPWTEISRAQGMEVESEALSVSEGIASKPFPRTNVTFCMISLTPPNPSSSFSEQPLSFYLVQQSLFAQICVRLIWIYLCLSLKGTGGGRNRHSLSKGACLFEKSFITWARQFFPESYV